LLMVSLFIGHAGPPQDVLHRIAAVEMLWKPGPSGAEGVVAAIAIRKSHRCDNPFNARGLARREPKGWFAGSTAS